MMVRGSSTYLAGSVEEVGGVGNRVTSGFFL